MLLLGHMHVASGMMNVTMCGSAKKRSGGHLQHAHRSYLSANINMLLVYININNRTFFSKCFYNHIMAVRCVVDGGRCVLCASNHFFSEETTKALP